MIRKVEYGTVFDTGAIVKEVEKIDKLPEYLEVNDADGICITYKMGKKDVVFGLGENVRGINKRGFTYISHCIDTDKHIGGTDCDIFSIQIPCGNAAVYYIEQPTVKEIVKEFRENIGQSYIAPKWAFGYQQSRWSYMSSEEVRDVVKNYKENDIPLEVMHLDIDYMDGYRNFTINRKDFPDFEDMVSDLKNQNVKVVTIVDAGIKREEGYDIYDEAKENGYFCTYDDGGIFTATVWPGKCNFPDFFRKEVRDWFGGHCKMLLDMGVDGFWNDMNEPSIFYTEKGFRELMEYVTTVDDKTSGVEIAFQTFAMVQGVTNNPKDFKTFYHCINGEKVCNESVHNLYGYQMLKGVGESVDKLCPGERKLLFSRSSYIGSHRYGGIWTGDNNSWWSHLLLNIKMMPSLNMCGYLYAGADIGGFSGDNTEDLMIRWLQFGMFTPLFRNHTSLNTKRQELYLFKQKDIMRSMVKLHYALVPYLYSEFVKAAVRNEMMFSPLSFEYPEDEHCYQVEDQLFVGESIMVAPVHEQNATGRYVYLPEEMMCITFRSVNDRTCNVYEKGHHYIPCELNEVLIFIRKNHLLPLGKEVSNTSELDYENLELIGFGNATYELYNDDGLTKDYDFTKNVTKLCL